MSFIVALLILCAVILLLNRVLDKFMVKPFVANHRDQTLHIGTDGIYWHKAPALQLIDEFCHDETNGE